MRFGEILGLPPAVHVRLPGEEVEVELLCGSVWEEYPDEAKKTFLHGEEVNDPSEASSMGAV